jgi:hypothetical protein
MQVCDALHGFYKALYEKARMAMSRQNGQAMPSANVVEAQVVVDSDGVVDFGADDGI